MRWIVSWRAPAVLFAGVASTILWIYSNRKDKASTDQNIESGPKAPSNGDVGHENTSKGQTEPTIEELQASI